MSDFAAAVTVKIVKGEKLKSSTGVEIKFKAEEARFAMIKDEAKPFLWKSKVVRDSTDPVFEETTQVFLYPGVNTIPISVLDADDGNNVIGKVDLVMNEDKPFAPIEATYDVDAAAESKITISYTYIPFEKAVDYARELRIFKGEGEEGAETEEMKLKRQLAEARSANCKLFDTIYVLKTPIIKPTPPKKDPEPEEDPTLLEKVVDAVEEKK